MKKRCGHRSKMKNFQTTKLNKVSPFLVIFSLFIPHLISMENYYHEQHRQEKNNKTGDEWG
jgi:hypothetical protein